MAPYLLECKGCNHEIDDITKLMKCTTCKMPYHFQCTDIKKVTKSTRTSWKCPKCILPPSLLTPQTISAKNVCSSDPNISVRSTRISMNPTTSSVLSTENHDKLISEIKVSIAGMLEDRFLDLQNKYKELKNQNNAILESLEFMTNKHDDVIKIMEVIKSERDDLKTENIHIKKRLTYLEEKIDQLEYQNQNGKIEIRGIPEKPSENLIESLKLISQTIKCNIATEDIISITRSTAINHSTRNPRPVIAKFSTQLQRDTFLDSVKSFNRACKNNSEKLNTTHLKLSNEQQPIYISDLLTQKGKYLLMMSKKFAKQHNFAYCWTKNGRIFLKQKDKTKTFTVTNDDSFSKISNFFHGDREN